MVFSAEIRVAEPWKQHKHPGFIALLTQTLPAHNSKVLLPALGSFPRTDLYFPCIFQSGPGLEMLPLFGVLHVQLMFFIINASQNLQSAPDLHIKESH